MSNSLTHFARLVRTASEEPLMRDHREAVSAFDKDDQLLGVSKLLVRWYRELNDADIALEQLSMDSPDSDFSEARQGLRSDFESLRDTCRSLLSTWQELRQKNSRVIQPPSDLISICSLVKSALSSDEDWLGGDSVKSAFERTRREG